MENIEIYDYILESIENDIAEYGYKRSGKSTLFYRYFNDKKICCGLLMCKSIYNLPGWYRFYFSSDCVCVDDVGASEKERLTLKDMREHLSGWGYSLDEIYEIGSPWGYSLDRICETGGYIVTDCEVKAYYKEKIKPDIIKTVAHLNEKAEKTMLLNETLSH